IGGRAAARTDDGPRRLTTKFGARRNTDERGPHATARPLVGRAGLLAAVVLATLEPRPAPRSGRIPEAHPLYQTCGAGFDGPGPRGTASSMRTGRPGERLFPRLRGESGHPRSAGYHPFCE